MPPEDSIASTCSQLVRNRYPVPAESGPLAGGFRQLLNVVGLADESPYPEEDIRWLLQRAFYLGASNFAAAMEQGPATLRDVIRELREFDAGVEAGTH